LKWLAQRTPHALKVSTAFIVAVCVELRAFTISFLKQLFLLIHSEMRLLCLFDAALGSVIGYFAGNVLIGAIAGGVLGVLNFEILSRRILRLVP
jgi:hypothetical protein